MKENMENNDKNKIEYEILKNLNQKLNNFSNAKKIGKTKEEDSKDKDER